MIGGSDGPNGGRRGDMPWSRWQGAVTTLTPRHLSWRSGRWLGVARSAGPGAGGVCGMRPSRLTTPALAVLLAVTVTACTDAPSSSQPTPTTGSTTATIAATTPSPSVSSSSEQQAAVAAKAALLTYERTVDRVLQAGGDDPSSSLARVATGTQLRILREDAAAARKNGWRQKGSTSVKDLRVKGVEISNPPRVKLQFCLDASKTEGVDSQGRSIRRPGADAYFVEVATLVKDPTRGWLVSEEDDKAVKSC
jgi:hypothetical protein